MITSGSLVFEVNLRFFFLKILNTPETPANLRKFQEQSTSAS